MSYVSYVPTYQSYPQSSYISALKGINPRIAGTFITIKSCSIGAVHFLDPSIVALGRRIEANFCRNPNE
jgi:hypothetical protein